MSESMPQRPTVMWWEIPVTDVAKGKDFYGSVFGWTYTSMGDDENYAIITVDGDFIGGLFKAPPDTPTAPSVRIYVNVADLEATLQAVESAGGSVTKPRTEVGGDMGWWAEIADPDGRWLGLTTSNAPRG